MSKPSLNRLAGLATAAAQESFGLGDLFALASGLKVPPGFPAGTIAPDGAPDSEGRELIRKLLADDFVRWDHETLARAAAHLFEGALLWRGFFAHYAKDKEIEIRQTKTDLMKALLDANEEFLQVLRDPGTRAYLNAQARLAKDPKQNAMGEALKLWQDWQSGKTLHKSGAAFDRYVVEKLPVIRATKTVERWRARWQKEAKEQ